MSKLARLDNIRIDQNIGYYIDKLKKYNEDEDLLKSLLLYMCFNFQKNLFGYSTLDPTHFASVMNHGVENLKRKHPNPIYHKYSGRSKEEAEMLQEKHGRVSAYRILDSRLENALLILMHEGTLDTYLSKSEYAEIIKLSDFRFIEDIQVVIEKRKKAKKLTYLYKLSEQFEYSLKKMFFNANISTYNTLRKKNLEDWYLKLKNRINICSNRGENQIVYSIQELAQVMNISTETLGKKGGFSRVKNRINDKFNNTFSPAVTNEIEQLQLSWVKGKGARTYNTPIVKWKNKSKEELKALNNIIYTDIFFTELFKDLSVYYSNNYEKFSHGEAIIYERFLLWLLSPKDYEVKTSKYVSNYVDYKGRHDDVQRDAISFFEKIINIGKINLVEKIVYYNDGRYVFKNKFKGQEFEYLEIKDLFFELTQHYKFFESHYMKLILK
ncbi:hypothetical protein [Tenacibaculum agarivorans]|uniref:hypothetical protein n=1 Tax=Tenacibaculum agarivorans TaxID=1908389 RepID=UPI000A54280B|nr:hypothetical protein [Tenacibaculum agarivorans]